MAALTLYGSSVADGTLATACDMAIASGGVEVGKQTTVTGANDYAEVTSQGLTVASVAAIPATPTGKGWVYSPGVGLFATGNWSASIAFKPAAGPLTPTLTLRFFRYSGGGYTLIGSIVVSINQNSLRATYAFPATSLSGVTFGASDLLYTDLWLFDSSGAGGDNPTIYLSTSTANGVANDLAITTASFTPTVALSSCTLPGTGTLSASAPSLATALAASVPGVGTVAATIGTTLATVLTLGNDTMAGRTVAAVSTSSATTIVAGFQTFTPTSMVGVFPGMTLHFSGGTGTAEDVLITATTGTTATGFFVYGHSGAYTITAPSSFGQGSDGQVWDTPSTSLRAVVGVASGKASVYYDNSGGGYAVYETLYGANSQRYATQDGVITMNVRCGNPASDEFRLYGRYVDSQNWYRYDFSGNSVRLQSSVAGSLTTTTLGSFTMTANVLYSVKFSFVGSTFTLKIWLAGGTEPTVGSAGAWQTTNTASNRGGLYGVGFAPIGTTLGTGIQFDSFLVTSAALARDVYVATTGSDSNPGTSISPFATIQAGIDAALPGSTVHVAAGTYTITCTTAGIVTQAGLTCQGSGFDGTTRILIISDTPRGAHLVVNGQGGADTDAYAWAVYASYIYIVGFDIQGSGRAGIQGFGSYCSVFNCCIHDIPATSALNGGAAIDFDPSHGGHDCNMTGNLVYNIGTGTDNSIHGLYLAVPGTSSLWNLIQNNLVFNCSGAGINIGHNGNHITCSNNLVAATRAGGPGIYLWSSYSTDPCSYNVVNNNLLIHNTGDGSGGAIRESATCTNNTYTNNLIFATGAEPTTIVYYGGVGTVVSGTILADPLLVNYQSDGSGDYHLSASSPAINAGTTTGAPATDYDGNVRPLGASYDIGPYEFFYALSCTLSGAGQLSGTLAGALSLTGQLSGVGTLTPTLSAKRALPSVVLAGVGTMTGALIATTALAATSPGVGTLAVSSPTLKTALSGTLSGSGTCVPTMTASIRLSGGTLAGVGACTIAAPTVATALTSTLTGDGSLVGTLSAAFTLSGATLAGVGQLSASAPSLATALAASVPGVGTLSGQPGAALALPGVMLAGVGTLSGAMQAQTALADTLAGMGTLSGTLSLQTALSGTLSGIGTLSGVLSGGGALAGTLAGAGTLSAALSLATSLTGQLSGTGTLAAQLSANLALSGVTIAGQGGLTGIMSEATALSGASAGAGTCAGTLSLFTALTGQLSGSGTLSATLAARLSLTETVAGGGTLAGTLSATTALGGQCAGAGMLAGAFILQMPLGMMGAGAGQLAGVLSLRTALFLTCAGVGTLSPMLVIAGGIAITLGGVGTLSGAISFPGPSATATWVTRDHRATWVTRDDKAGWEARDLETTWKE